MRVIWLGQSGLLFETDNYKIMIDPYLSDSVGEQTGKHRRMEINEMYLREAPDVIICTHNHLDHLDPKSLEVLLNLGSKIQVLAPWEGWQRVRQFGGEHNYILFNRMTEVTLTCGISVKAVRAEHSDISAIGVIIQAEGKNYYVTGDTLYNDEIFKDVPDNIHAIFLPINGEGNNMNMADARKFVERVGADIVVPIHWGMLDDLDASSFECPNRLIPELYKSIEL